LNILNFFLILSSEESEDEDDDDDELQAELQRIREEREAAQKRKIQEDLELQQRIQRESAMKSNPLAIIEEGSAKVNLFLLIQLYFFHGHQRLM
jgi:hypothetical protein